MPRSREARGNRQIPDRPTSVVIPEKLYFRIGEVSELAETKPYVLRYWETEFPMLQPAKSPSGHRLYRRQDVEMVLIIKRLLYQEGFTIEGARKHLTESSRRGSTIAPAAEVSAVDGAPLRAIQRELKAILTMLSRKC